MTPVRILLRFRGDEAGASMVEYGVALLVIIAIGTAGMTALGSAVFLGISDACSATGTSC